MENKKILLKHKSTLKKKIIKIKKNLTNLYLEQKCINFIIF